ncbi:MAG: hypothetical protein VB817_00210, partial [Pirellulaceae bacterium]
RITPGSTDSLLFSTSMADIYLMKEDCRCASGEGAVLTMAPREIFYESPGPLLHPDEKYPALAR